MSRMSSSKAGRRVRRQFSEEFKGGAVRLVLDERKTIVGINGFDGQRNARLSDPRAARRQAFPLGQKVHVRRRLVGQRRAADVADDADDFSGRRGAGFHEVADSGFAGREEAAINRFTDDDDRRAAGSLELVEVASRFERNRERGSEWFAPKSSAKQHRPSASLERGRFLPGSPRIASKTRDPTSTRAVTATWHNT